MFDIPPRAPEGRLTVRRSRPTPCRQSSPRQAVGKTAHSCGVRRYGVMLHGATELPRGSAASSAILHSLDDWLCGGVAARGRAASPTKRGLYCIDVHVLFEFRYFGNGTSHLYPLFYCL
jgi:hypothetical protein